MNNPVAPSAPAATPATKAEIVVKSSWLRRLLKKLANFHWFGLGYFLKDDAIKIDQVANDAVEMQRYHRIVTLIKRQAIVIAILIAVIMIGGPMLHNVYRFHALNGGSVRDLTALDGPTLTNQAVLSWATNSITEILTVGFGDFDQKLNSQQQRFTSEGWRSFVDAIYAQGLRKNFRERQLVLTTVPSNAAVITAQGLNADKEYQWVVELPIIMTYTTNNNVKQVERTIIRLNIVRVAPSKSIGGLAIKSWNRA